MMARSNPHSSMPSPARSPLGEGEDENEDADGEEDDQALAGSRESRDPGILRQPKSRDFRN